MPSRVTPMAMPDSSSDDCDSSISDGLVTSRRPRWHISYMPSSDVLPKRFLIEAQALVSTAAYGTPQRSVTGFDSKRMNMLLAVLEKRVGFKLAQKDVFLNIAGGLKVNDPALDLAVICAILSSNVDMPVPRRTCMSGEVGLSGEIRPITRIEQRIMEAEKLGMDTIIIPRHNLKGIDTSKLKINIVEVAKVEEAFRQLFA